ncbi:class I SAM-dependent methyltransferase [Actinoalloteichus hymeniacidonis]|uniref:Methyltransferase domain n=1 Tax=Actinoalloteichus hymeniacidonis TaxID=340345 RepID=A0AAC9HTG1_9PSEU|nr:methyltransferase domain-containing protein [Actinoalloteichus hymeniacidonis]AOS65080.1 Methyltransferase domain [Actinoalloteichus hymeniacidonis]
MSQPSEKSGSVEESEATTPSGTSESQPPGPSGAANPQDENYSQAFAAFLAHTDQKRRMWDHLESILEALPRRDVLIDAGAGEGGTTAWLSGSFRRTIAIEPNSQLRVTLQTVCPTATVLPTKILDTEPAERGDLVLNSHVLYYIPRQDWSPVLARLASWTSDTGQLIVVLENPDSAAMVMVAHFTGLRFDLTSAAEEFLTGDAEGRWVVRIDTSPARVRAPDLETATTVAEFILGIAPAELHPTRAQVTEYVQQHFAADDGSYTIDCTQDLLRIRHP